VSAAAKIVLPGNLFASFAAEVVFPVPLTPTIRITPDLVLRSFFDIAASIFSFIACSGCSLERLPAAINSVVSSRPKSDCRSSVDNSSQSESLISLTIGWAQISSFGSSLTSITSACAASVFLVNFSANFLNKLMQIHFRANAAK